MMWKYAADFERKGYAVIPADDLDAIVKLREQILDRAKCIFGETQQTVEEFFNFFHHQGVTGATLNERRLQLISEVNANVDSGSLIFQGFRSTIIELLGPDLLVQKNTNLVIQQPQDPNPSELHRDAPANSPFEVVVWLPLTDSYGTKAMYILDRDGTRNALKHVEDASDLKSMEAYVRDSAPNLPVPFGSALFFWAGLLHGSRVNVENETRWTLNQRFKNLFSPNGGKEPFEFFKIHQLSPLCKSAMELLRREALE